jgi:hypothetical protein
MKIKLHKIAQDIPGNTNPKTINKAIFWGFLQYIRLSHQTTMVLTKV